MDVKERISPKFPEGGLHPLSTPPLRRASSRFDDNTTVIHTDQPTWTTTLISELAGRPVILIISLAASSPPSVHPEQSCSSGRGPAGRHGPCWRNRRPRAASGAAPGAADSPA